MSNTVLQEASQLWDWILDCIIHLGIKFDSEKFSRILQLECKQNKQYVYETIRDKYFCWVHAKIYLAFNPNTKQRRECLGVNTIFKRLGRKDLHAQEF